MSTLQHHKARNAGTASPLQVDAAGLATQAINCPRTSATMHLGKPVDYSRPVEGATLKPLTVSVKTARQLLGIGNSKMWELIAEGRVETICLGRKRLVLYHSLEMLVRSSHVAK